MNVEYCSDTSPGWFFSKDVTCRGWGGGGVGVKNTAPTTVSPHLIRKPGGLPTNCHNFFVNSLGLTAWVSLWPYKPTQTLTWLYSLWLALDSPPLRKQPPYSFWSPCESGEIYPWKTLGSKLITPQESHPHGMQPSLSPSLAHVEQVTKPDHCLTNLTSNLPQVKNDLYRILTFLYSRIWMNQVEKWNAWKMQKPDLQNAVICMGPPQSSATSWWYWLQAGSWGTEIVLGHSRMCAC